MQKISILLVILLLLPACIPKRNFYRPPINQLKLKRAAFKEFANLIYKNGKTARVLFTKVTQDSITIVNLDNKSIDPLVKTISINAIESIKVFEEKDGNYIIYTFDKPKK